MQELIKGGFDFRTPGSKDVSYKRGTTEKTAQNPPQSALTALHGPVHRHGTLSTLSSGNALLGGMHAPNSLVTQRVMVQDVRRMEQRLIVQPRVGEHTLQREGSTSA